MAGVIRVAKALAIAFLLLVAGYAAAGLAGGAIPVNAAWRPPAHGITIYVESNGVHTGLILPKVAAGIDWRPLVPARDLADPRHAAFDHVAFGWGERAFYLETKTWADVKVATILAAAFGSEATLIHVEHLPRPAPADDIRAIVLRPQEYRRLAAHIAASFARHPAHYRGYAGHDTFYDARGHYDAVRTCNAWTGAALRTAGVRVGWWTPFPVTVMAWF